VTFVQVYLNTFRELGVSVFLEVAVLSLPDPTKPPGDALVSINKPGGFFIPTGWKSNLVAFCNKLPKYQK